MGTCGVGGKILSSCVVSHRLLLGGGHRRVATAASCRHCPDGQSEARFLPRTGMTSDHIGLGLCSQNKAARLCRELKT